MANEFRVKNGIVSPSITLQGAVSGSITIQAGDSPSGTLTLPNASAGEVVTSQGTQTVSDKQFNDEKNYFVDFNDTTKRFKFDVGSITTATTRTIAVPDENTTLVGTTATQTLTNKTLTSPKVTGLAISDSGFTVEGSTDDNFETTVTFTNPSQDQTVTFADKTGIVALSTNTLGFFASTTSSELATVVSDDTGSGALVFATSPTFSTSMDGSATFGAFASSTSLTIGYNSTGTASTLNISTAANTDNVVKTINIGTGGVGTSTTNINFGSSASTTLGTTTFNNDVVIARNLTVNGLTTTVNSNTITVDDKNLELGSVVAKTGLTGNITSTATTTTITDITSTAGLIVGQVLAKTGGVGAFGGYTKIVSIDGHTQLTILSTTSNTAGSVTFNVEGASDSSATGGGITLKGTTDKTISWQPTVGWTSSENINLAAGQVYRINGTEVLSSTKVLGVSLTGTGNVVTSGSFWSRTFAFMGT